MKQMSTEQFLIDVSKHEMKVHLKDGLYRHLMFRKPTTGNMWFEIVTWPGSLAIHGDMGTWSFSRIDDMFAFFRSKELKINASYWSEKVDSESRFGGPTEKFNARTFKANVISSLEGYDLRAPKKSELLDALEEEVFREEDESTARRALSDFEHGGFTFSDPWEIDGNAYTYHFLWCLHAIVWAIQQYDSTQAAENRRQGA